MVKDSNLESEFFLGHLDQSQLVQKYLEIYFCLPSEPKPHL